MVSDNRWEIGHACHAEPNGHFDDSNFQSDQSILKSMGTLYPVILLTRLSRQLRFSRSSHSWDLGGVQVSEAISLHT